MAAEIKVLAVSKAEKKHDCPIALFEPPDPSKRVMYCKDKVYQGTTEFSFEELRALRFKERQRQLEEIEEMERRKAELLEIENRVKEQQEQMLRQMAEWQKQMAVKATESLGCPTEKVETNSPPLSRNPSLDSTAALLAANPTG